MYLPRRVDHKVVNFIVKTKNYYKEPISITGLRTSCNLGLLCQGGKMVYASNNYSVSFIREFDTMRRHYVFTYEELFDSKVAYVVDDKVTVVGEVLLFIKNNSQNKLQELKSLQVSFLAQKGIQIGPKNFDHALYKEMFIDTSFADFEVRTGDGGILKAHRFLLAARSPVFRLMLRPITKEFQENFVYIKDFDSVIMKEVLRFFYCNEVENLDEIAKDLIYAAEKYDIDRLKEKCLESLSQATVLDNVFESLTIAYLLSDTNNLFEKCVEIIMV